MLVVKYWYCVAPPKEMTTLQLHIKKKQITTGRLRTQEEGEVNRRFCCSQRNFIKGVIFPELELIISMKSLFNPVLTFWLFILSSLCIDCIFSSSCLHFNLTCSIRSLILLGSVLEMEAFHITGKESFLFWRFRLLLFKAHFKQYWHWFCK